MPKNRDGLTAGYSGGSGGPIAFPDYSDGGSNTKLTHDTYEVYVNGDFVGNKVLITQNANIKDVQNFLSERGFHDFTAEQIGDHIEIRTGDASQTKPMKENLHSYLEIR